MLNKRDWPVLSNEVRIGNVVFNWDWTRLLVGFSVQDLCKQRMVCINLLFLAIFL